MQPGSKLGPYEILEPLGAGGMGEVYLAQDTRLGRKVAIKVLPEQFAVDRERLARFEQEARAAAALNHPHIAVVHDVGHDAGVHFMVQEFIDGETLRTALTAGRMALPRALELGAEIAQGLAAAHGAGIVHRDLKPENVFVTTSGHAKIVDFGLAKLMEASIASDAGATRSPTMLGTAAGQVMGTAGYMAPEQLEGGKIDARADVFAFGCVLYEMVAGQRAFAGKSLIDTLHKIAHSEPRAIAEVDARAPAELQRILAKCLAKEPARRYHHADEAAVDLRALAGEVQSGTTQPAALAAPQPGDARAMPWLTIAAALAGVALGVVGARYLASPTTADAPGVVRLQIPINAALTGRNVPAWSPEGDEFVFVAREDGTTTTQLWSRRIDDFQVRPLPNSDGASAPFFAPDGQWLGFGRGGAIWRMSRAGGAPTKVIDFGMYEGGAWDEQGDLFITGRPSDGSTGLYRLPAGSDRLELLWNAENHPNAIRALHPTLWPGNLGLVFTAFGEPGSIEDDAIMFWSRDTGEVTELFRGGVVPYPLGNRHLAYLQSDNRLTVRGFDAQRAVLIDPPPRAFDLQVPGLEYALSPQGHLVASNWTSTVLSRPALIDSQGRLTPLDLPPGGYRSPRFSPDGSRLALLENSSGPDGKLGILDMNEPAALRPVRYGERAYYPLWGQDGSSLIVSGPLGLQSLTLNDSAAAPRSIDPGFRVATDWAPDGRLVVLTPSESSDDFDIALLDPESGELTPFLATPASETAARMSPDGRWMAYVSSVSGRRQVYVRPFPEATPEFLVSADMGLQPVWSPTGDAIYFYNDGQLVEARVDTRSGFRVVARRDLFAFNPNPNVFGESFDVDPGGNGFVVLQRVGGDGESGFRGFAVVLNWVDEALR